MSFNFATCRNVPPNNFFLNPPFDNSIRPWSRARGFQCLTNVNSEDLNMRRKAEILKYKNNNANMSSKQLYSRRARGIGVEQKAWGTQPFISGNTTITFDNKAINSLTNPNIRNLKRVENILICPSKTNPICNPSSNSDVPGNKILCFDKNIPLVGYNESISYSKIGTSWPQRSWEPGDEGFPVGKIGSRDFIDENPIIISTEKNSNEINEKNSNEINDKNSNPNNSKNNENTNNIYYELLLDNMLNNMLDDMLENTNHKNKFSNAKQFFKFPDDY